MKDVVCLQTIQQLLTPVGDIERVIGRIALVRAQVHDYRALRGALGLLPDIKKALESKQHLALCKVIQQHISDFGPLYQLLQRALPEHITADQLVASGFDAQLDYMRDLINNSTQKMLTLEKNEQEKTGIQSLKIRYNNVHGYYIEITNANKDAVPDRYMRRQTLVGKERYTIGELQQLEAEIMHARSQIDHREKEIFELIKRNVFEYISSLRKLAHALAHLDALHGFAKIAYNNGYVKPLFDEGNDITIMQGRHPIIDREYNVGFIANDTYLNDEQSLWIITGPNMGGKSTYLRQVALICIMAQCGSFVPAKAAKLPLIDRIFTRIGAGDNLAAGKSTFLVEMEETASICTQATQNSLVILDEVGRGTSTFDGLAIAQAVVEYLHHTVKPRCLFATHYHELTQLSKQLPGVASFYMASKKTESGILFLYTITPGVADGSFGVEVAKLAELPHQVVVRAQEILNDLTAREQGMMVPASQNTGYEPAYRALIIEHEILKKQTQNMKKQVQIAVDIKKVNFDELSPKQAFDLLWQWKEGVESFLGDKER
jgi:Mismatch repair ATPase (MutS family)